MLAMVRKPLIIVSYGEVVLFCLFVLICCGVLTFGFCCVCLIGVEGFLSAIQEQAKKDKK